MKAIGYEHAGLVSDDKALLEFEAMKPTPGANDLLVEVHGVSVNPVDVKVRERAEPDGGPKILGFDAAGIVKAVGKDVQHFKPGDEVFYAGDITRPGTNADMHVVDERIVGRKPKTLDFAEAAGLPLTSITAWEMLFDCFGLEEGAGEGDALLIIGGAGGVGSIMIQLAKALTKLEVIATASRDDTRDWVKKMGADYVINHRQPLNEEIKTLGVSPRYVAALTATDQHMDAIIDLIKPRGVIAVIDDPETLDVKPLKTKSLTLSWEFMFARSMFQTDDMIVQQQLLNRVADLVDSGAVVSTVSNHAGPLTPDSLQQAHEFQNSGKAIGKTVLGRIA